MYFLHFFPCSPGRVHLYFPLWLTSVGVHTRTMYPWGLADDPWDAVREQTPILFAIILHIEPNSNSLPLSPYFSTLGENEKKPTEIKTLLIFEFKQLRKHPYRFTFSAISTCMYVCVVYYSYTCSKQGFMECEYMRLCTGLSSNQSWWPHPLNNTCVHVSIRNDRGRTHSSRNHAVSSCG